MLIFALWCPNGSMLEAGISSRSAICWIGFIVAAWAISQSVLGLALSVMFNGFRSLRRAKTRPGPSGHLDSGESEVSDEPPGSPRLLCQGPALVNRWGGL